ncbi:hypothetical protein CRG98_006265 [Punica granatum]|uniref:Chlororespiratory reduction 42 n=1 Tax=Punica granatum TaxID=22663 RepID=A0A2I0KXY0_PUNGR|nr:hypothetical protein CRG98_006265 [Punica granatum]
MSTFTMALSLSSSKASFPFLNLSCGSATPKNRFDARRTSLGAAIRCEPGNGSLEIGSPVIVVEAPKMIKTAASVPCLRVNSGLVNPGDVGRIVSRKPKDVWAVRLAIGTYLIDAKYFKPLKLDDDDKIRIIICSLSDLGAKFNYESHISDLKIPRPLSSSSLLLRYRFPSASATLALTPTDCTDTGRRQKEAACEVQFQLNSSSIFKGTVPSESKARPRESEAALKLK